MSEAGGYFHEQRAESSHSEMLCTREVDRSFLPLKRKMFDQSNNEQIWESPSGEICFACFYTSAGAKCSWFLITESGSDNYFKLEPAQNSALSLPEHPPSKRFLAEECVVSHLEHLKLSPDHRWDSHALPTPGETKRRSLNMKTVASCPNSIECQMSRKRGYGQCEGHVEYGSWSSKRMRLDPVTGILPISAKRGNRTNCGMELDPHQHNSTAVLASVHGIGSVSDLSSIPEEAEPNQQPSAPSGVSLDPDSDNDENELSAPLVPLCPSPSPPPLLFPFGSDTSKLDSEHCSVWLAPEIQTIRANALLPTSIVEEIKCTGMEVVPWVGLDAVLQGQGRVHREEESSGSNELSSPQPSTSQTSSIADHDVLSCDHKDFGMELN